MVFGSGPGGELEEARMHRCRLAAQEGVEQRQIRMNCAQPHVRRHALHQQLFKFRRGVSSNNNWKESQQAELQETGIPARQ